MKHPTNGRDIEKRPYGCDGCIFDEAGSSCKDGPRDKFGDLLCTNGVWGTFRYTDEKGGDDE